MAIARIIAFVVLAGCAAAAVRPNVLFIAVDDLRPWLGCYDPAFPTSPHIDRLAAGGRVFTRHYVHVPTCGASRCALLFGRYPGRFPEDGGNDAILKTAAKQPVPALPVLFRRHGYRTISVGKISHFPGGRGGKGWAVGPEELPGAWDLATMPAGPWKTPEGAMHGYASGVTRQDAGDDKKRKPLTQSARGDDMTYPDGWIAEEAVVRLQAEAGGDAPFFLAVGFIKPHLPFAAPESYFAETAGAEPTLPRISEKPAFPSTWHGSGEFRNYGWNEGDPFESPAAAQAYRKAYLACIRYTDAQIGKLLAALEASPAAGNTVVVLWGDHGWLLGEHAIWGKHCLFEEALHSPLIIRVPGDKFPGGKSDAIVETVDLYPTLAALAGLPLSAGLDGASLVPQLENPRAPSDGFAFAAWGKHVTLRTATHRLILPRDGGEHPELYDHRTDPAETSNAAAEQPDIGDELRRHLERIRRKDTRSE